jgi:hypothetical protein
MRIVLAIIALSLVTAGPVSADTTPTSDISDRLEVLEKKIESVEDDLSDNAGRGMVLFLFGAFCALWAQNTRRNAWLWFFLGLLFSVVTVIFLLAKNSADRRRAEDAGFDMAD